MDDLINDIIKEDTIQKSNTILDRINATKNKLKMAKSKKIEKLEPIITQNGNPVIFPNTINFIQGQSGSHKSRLAGVICSAILKMWNCHNELLGYKLSGIMNLLLCYCDTERNYKEQFPQALQGIQVKAGYSIEDHPERLDYLSLLEFSRAERMGALKLYIEKLRKDKPGFHIFMILDVLSDCVGDFNNVRDTLLLIDMMNVMINEYDITFLCVLHENPSTDKARGHLGTELHNKSSTIMKIKREGEKSDLFKVQYLKFRSVKGYEPFYVKYGEKAEGLVMADSYEIKELIDSKKKKDLSPVINAIESTIGEHTLSNKVFIKELCDILKKSDKTVGKYLTKIMDDGLILKNRFGEDCTLLKEKPSKEVFWRLEKIVHP